MAVMAVMAVVAEEEEEKVICSIDGPIEILSVCFTMISSEIHRLKKK